MRVEFLGNVLLGGRIVPTGERDDVKDELAKSLIKRGLAKATKRGGKSAGPSPSSSAPSPKDDKGLDSAASK